MDFEWDDGNIFHVARHRITISEAEEVATDGNRLTRSIGYVGAEWRALIVGSTASGRVLKLIVTRRGQAVRVVTAYLATRRDQRRYDER